MGILEALKNNGFATIDYVVVIFYIILLVGLGLFLSRGKKGQEKSSNDYFLAGNTLTWWAVGASLIAANISAEQFIGMSGSAFASGIAIAAYELMAAATLLVVGKFLLPLMIERKIFTIPQFLSDRYNWGVGLSFSIFWLFLYVFINLTSVAWLGALAIKQILGLPTVNWVVMLGSFFVFFVFGYLLYAAIFAGVGAMSDQDTETQQFVIPITIPLLLPFLLLPMILTNPNGTLAVWLSQIPFTSPIAMMARLPFGVPYWQVTLSILLLVFTCFLFVRFSAKLYRSGLLMYGQKFSVKTIAKVLRESHTN